MQDTAILVDEDLRLYRALRDGSGPPCTKPWVSLEERSTLGHVKPCCWIRGTLKQFVGLCSDIGITPNFNVVGNNREATRRSLLQNTELGVRPRDIANLTENLEGAIAHAQTLNLNFAAESLERVRGELQRTPA